MIRMTSLKNKKRIKKVIIFLALVLIVSIVDLPVVSMVGTSFKKNDAVVTTSGLFPAFGEWSLENYEGVLVKAGFGKYIVNSTYISVLATLICVVISGLAGYSLSRYRHGVNKVFSMMLFLMQMFPMMLLLIPMFVLLSKYGMVNKPLSVTIYYAASNLAFNIVMIRGFFDSIPSDLEEAATIDGCSRFQAFLKVIVPISLPGIATVAIITFLNCWNEFTFASLLLRKSELQTITEGLTTFVQQNNSNWGYLMAASSIALLPAFVFLLFAQKYLVQGLTAGSVKG